MGKKKVSIIFVLILALSLFSGCGKSSKKENKKIGDKINTYIDTLAKDKQFSGSVLVAKKDKILTNKSVGYENYEVDAKNTVASKFRIEKYD